MSKKEILEAIKDLGERFKTVETTIELFGTRLISLETRMSKLEGQVSQLIKWTERQDISLENEMTKQLLSYLQEHYKGYVSTENLQFPKQINIHGKTITDFDGLIFMSNGTEIMLVILEAKQCITYHKLQSKLRQKKLIEELIADIKSGKIEKPIELNEINVTTFNDQVGLYIGAIEFKHKVKEELIKEAANNPLIGFIELNGTRFTVNDNRNEFGKVLYGGRFKK